MVISVTAWAAPVSWNSSQDGNDQWYEVAGINQALANTAVQAWQENWHLVTITPAAENVFLYSPIKNDLTLWLAVNPTLDGCKSGTSATSYSWVTGEPLSYTRWQPNESYGNGNRTDFAEPFLIMDSDRIMFQLHDLRNIIL
jgi:hypothetical protein